jgi:hypothetical protein
MANKGWSKRSDEPIVLDDGTTLTTLRQAIEYLANTVPKAEHNHPSVLTASDHLTRSAEQNYPMFAASSWPGSYSSDVRIAVALARYLTSTPAQEEADLVPSKEPKPLRPGVSDCRAGGELPLRAFSSDLQSSPGGQAKPREGRGTVPRSSWLSGRCASECPCPDGYSGMVDNWLLWL